MENKFPNPCSQCGMCCLSVTCMVGQLVLDIPADEPCHALLWEGINGDIAVCKLAESGMVPVGDGCCIKAEAFIGDVCLNFADMPPELKRKAVREVRQHVSALLVNPKRRVG